MDVFNYGKKKNNGDFVINSFQDNEILENYRPKINRGHVIGITNQYNMKPL
jgi:hypothetical protein